MALGATHWSVRPRIRRRAERLVRDSSSTWNTYEDHPQGYHLDDVSVDFWGNGGRGDPLPPRVGDRICQRLLNQRARLPVAWIIWEGKIWQPHTGWQIYNGWFGDHYDHVHVTFRVRSETAGRIP